METVTLPGLRTQSGFTFEQVDVAYQTLGTLSPARDNAILICPALTGDAHVAGADPHTGRPGWWDYHVGPGKAIDTGKFFVICASVLGGCGGTTGPASLRPGAGKPYGMDFPPVTVRDMVSVQIETAGSSGHSATVRRHRWFDGRDAGAGFGGGSSGAGARLHSHCHLRFAHGNADCVQRNRTARHLERS